MTEALPDGLDPLVEHNLISFKSKEEAFDAWAANELIGHYVSYRKLVSPSTTDLLPEEQFQLFGVTARFPEGLAKQIELKPVRDGVYDCSWGVVRIRVIVIRELAGEARNIPLHLFSPNLAQRWAANAIYHEKNPDTSSLIRKLLIEIRQEDDSMLPPKLQEFFRDMKRKTIEELTPEEFREFVLKSQGFRDLPAEERVKDLSDEELEKIMEARKKKAETKN